MILIESMITVYNNKLRIDNISAFEQNYIQTIVSGSRSIERIESIEFVNVKERTIGKITLLTSHRLTNVHLADWIMVLEYGHIIEQGTRQELLQKEDSRFSELYQYQAKKYTTD